MVSTYQKHERQMWLLKFPTFFQTIPKHVFETICQQITDFKVKNAFDI